MTHAHALVTGASSGIGRGLALALARRGTFVVVAARRRERLDELCAEIARAGGAAEPLELDAADGDATYAAVRALDDKRPLDLVVANAGTSEFMPAEKLNWPDIKRILDVNLVGAAATFTGALDGMRARGAGQLVGVSSLAAFRSVPNFAAYSASKTGLLTLCRGLRMDLDGTGVSVTCVCTGFVKSEMTERLKSPTPFIMECDDAVREILRAIDTRAALRAFPWPVAAAMRASRLVPDALFGALNRRMKFGS